MKILHVTSRSDMGGGPQHIYLLLDLFSPAVESYVAAPSQKPFWNLFDGLVEGRIFELPFRSIGIFSLIGFLLYVARNNIDIIHTHGKGAGLYGRIGSLFLRVPLVHTCHGIHVNSHLSLLDRFYVVYERTTEFLIDRLIFVSESEQARALDRGIFSGRRSVVINNGVRAPVSRDATRSRAVLRRKYGIGEDDFLCVSLCRLAPEKNLFFLVEIAQLCPEACFLVFGDGPELIKLTTAVNELGLVNIQFPGLIQDAHSALSAADLFVSTSLMEGLPLSVIEAMSCGLPVVASRVPGHVDCVRHGETGFLFGLEDVSDPVNQIRRLINDLDLYRRTSQAAEALFLERFTARSMVRKIEDLYKDVLGLV